MKYNSKPFDLSLLVSAIFHLCLLIYLYHQNFIPVKKAAHPIIYTEYIQLPDVSKPEKPAPSIIKPVPVENGKNSRPSAPSTQATKSVPSGSLPSVKSPEIPSTAVEDASNPVPVPQQLKEPKPKQLPRMKDLLPSLDQMSKIDKSIEKAKPDIGMDGPQNCSNIKFTSYCNGLLDRLNRLLRYPEAAKSAGITGWGMVEVTVFRDGNIKARLTKSSGHAILDQAVLETIQQASPFNPFMDNMGTESLTEVYYFTFGLKINNRWVIQ